MSKQWPSKEQEIWFQAGVTGEKERIIKLLEAYADGPSDLSYSSGLHKAIELIKAGN